MANLSFTKMHGAGNDFIIIDNRDGMYTKEQITAWTPELCDRRFGIGADGIIALLKPENPSLDYTMFYRNADGSDAGMCGNGARCLALFAAEAGLGPKLTFNVHDAIYEAAVNAAEQNIIISFPMQVDIKEVSTDGEPAIYQMHAGTEHIVLEVAPPDFTDDENLKTKGETLRYDDQFNPPGTNVNFIKGVSPDKICIKTYEKGVENLTLACGTGAIAAALTWHHLHPNRSTENPIIVDADGGKLQVTFDYRRNENNYSNITLSGSAQFVFKGEYEIHDNKQ